MQQSTPQTKLASLQGFMQNLFIPLMPMMEQQGIVIDTRALARIVAEYGDLPELYDVFTSMAAPLNPERPSTASQKPAKSPVTQRNYVNENRSTATRPGVDREAITRLMGAGKGNGQEESMV
jgi:hypothetical protein